MKKCAFLITFLILTNFAIFAFTWPQSDVTENSFANYFGQKRGDSFCNSLVFQVPTEVVVAEEGAVLVVIGENSGEMGWFASPLGNSLILAHDDEMISVYGNMQTMDIDSSAKYLQTGRFVGTSGDSGWHNGQSGLEFQIIDTQKDATINPLLLMPQIGFTQRIRIQGVSAVSRDGTEYDLRVRRTVPAGRYSLYFHRNETEHPYSTTVSINGAAVETVTFDVLTKDKNMLSVSGKRLFTAKDVYPKEQKQLLAEISLAQGRNTINISAKSINGTETSLTYILDVR